MGMGWMVAKPTKIVGDNRNATDWAAEKMIRDGNRLIDICYMKVRERVSTGDILPQWIKGKSNSSDLLTKMVTKDVVDALMKTLQGLEPIPGATTRDVKETGNAEKLLSSVMMAEVYDFMNMMADQRDYGVLRPFNPSEVVNVKRPRGVKTTAWKRDKVLARY